MKDIREKNEIRSQKDNFIASLTHDLKTPIRADILTLELLLKGHFGELKNEQRDIIREILNSNKFMMNMIETLLTKYKYESEEIHLVKSVFDLNDFVACTTKELKYLFEEKNITYDFDFAKENPKINADKIELKRALSNLLSNAIKFNKKNGVVNVSTRIENGFAKIILEDTGIGINSEKIKYIFDKYVSYAKCFKQFGTGLGLYVAKKIVEAHEGRIEVSSKPQKGSIFTIILPIEINEKKED